MISETYIKVISQYDNVGLYIGLRGNLEETRDQGIARNPHLDALATASVILKGWLDHELDRLSGTEKENQDSGEMTRHPV